MFGKSLSEYVSFEKWILWLIVIVGLARLALSLGGIPNSSAKWLSISIVTLLGTIYVAIRVHTTGFGSYKQLLPLVWLQAALGALIIVGAIILGIVTQKDNIFTAPEYSGNQDGKTWLHVFFHVLGGLIVGPLIGWGVASLVLLITRKAAPKKA